MSVAGLPVVAEIVRSGFVEGHHYGSVVALAADGSVEWSVGEVAAPVLPRSSNKPVQALAMVELGLDLPDDLLALACASHSGEPFHVEGVRRTLASAGLVRPPVVRASPTPRIATPPMTATRAAGSRPTRRRGRRAGDGPSGEAEAEEAMWVRR